MITIRNRGRLPHWECESAIYFLTFRLADSLPAHILREIQFERKDIPSTAKAMRRQMSHSEERRLAELYSERVQSYLDAGTGCCALALPAIAELMANTLFHFDEQRYRIVAWCVMPNHVHVVFRPLAPHNLAEIVQAWKSFSSREAKRVLRRDGTFWMREYYDHLVRDQNDLQRIVAYVLENPAKAKLGDWPWVGRTRKE